MDVSKAKNVGDAAYETDEKHMYSQEVSVPIHNELQLATETDISLGAIIKGTATKPLTTFEKKAALINAEFDKFGMGRYQICIWFLCGFGYFLDLAWAQGVGLIATAIYQEMDVPANHTGNIWALSNAGLAVGALSFGLLVDIIGRKWAFNLTCLITSIFGLLLVRLLLPVNLWYADDVYRQLRSTIMVQSAVFTSLPVWGWEAISPSMH